jgi:hypothetical protein
VRLAHYTWNFSAEKLPTPSGKPHNYADLRSRLEAVGFDEESTLRALAFGSSDTRHRPKIWRRKLAVSPSPFVSCLSTQLWLAHHSDFIVLDARCPTKVRRVRCKSRLELTNRGAVDMKKSHSLSVASVAAMVLSVTAAQNALAQSRRHHDHDPGNNQSSGAVDPGVRGGPAGAGGPLPGLTAAQMAFFTAAQVRFSTIETVPAGLGPGFNELACANCHITNRRPTRNAHPTPSRKTRLTPWTQSIAGARYRTTIRTSSTSHCS